MSISLSVLFSEPQIQRQLKPSQPLSLESPSPSLTALLVNFSEIYTLVLLVVPHNKQKSGDFLLLTLYLKTTQAQSVIVQCESHPKNHMNLTKLLEINNKQKGLVLP